MKRLSAAKVATAEEGTDNGEGIGAERTQGGTVDIFVPGNEGTPGGSDNLPERGGTGTAGMVDGGHKECSFEHFMRCARIRGMIRFG